MLIIPEQIRAARARLRLDQATLAQSAGISVITLRRLEDRCGLSKVAPAIVDLVREVLEKAGAEFIDLGVCQRALTPEDIRSIKQDIDQIVARGAALMADYPPMTDDELYDEDGLLLRSSSILRRSLRSFEVSPKRIVSWIGHPDGKFPIHIRC